MSCNCKLKNRPLRVVTTKEEIDNMVKNREKIVAAVGEETYNRMLGLLEAFQSIKDNPEKVFVD